MTFNKYIFLFVLTFPFVLGLSFPGFPFQPLDPKCKALQPIVTDLVDNLFNHECGEAAHQALRLSFHDAIGISFSSGQGGGADGSIIIFNQTELQDVGNAGIEDVLDDLSPWYFKYASHMSPADLIQLLGVLGVLMCPGAPKELKFSIGRIGAPLAAAPQGLVPEPQQSVDQILARFADVNISAQEAVALLAAHSVGGSNGLAFPLVGVPFDSTPSTFDTNFFIDVRLNGTLFPSPESTLAQSMTAINGTIRLQSDAELANDPRTSCYWQAYAADHERMGIDFAAAFYKMSKLGADPNNLTDCSAILPQPKPLFDFPMFPPQQFLKDVNQSCPGVGFPPLLTQPGPPLNVAEIPPFQSKNT